MQDSETSLLTKTWKETEDIRDAVDMKTKGEWAPGRSMLRWQDTVREDLTAWQIRRRWKNGLRTGRHGRDPAMPHHYVGWRRERLKRREHPWGSRKTSPQLLFYLSVVVLSRIVSLEPWGYQYSKYFNIKCQIPTRGVRKGAHSKWPREKTKTGLSYEIW